MKKTSYSYRGHIAVLYGGIASVLAGALLLTALPGARVKAGSSGKGHRRLARHERGQAMVEFAMTLPVMFTLLMAIFVLGLAFNNYLTLTNATIAGAQQLSISRGQSTDPCATTSQTVQAAAPNLTTGITYSIAFGTGNPVSYGAPFTGASCTSAASKLVSGNTARVTVTYPCSLLIYGTNYAPSGCTLSAQTAELIQ
jgi:Flp pilus assembly protein TadG